MIKSPLVGLAFLAVSFLCCVPLAWSHYDIDGLQSLFSSAVLGLESTLAGLGQAMLPQLSDRLNQSLYNDSCQNLSTCLHQAQCLTLRDVSALYEFELDQILTQDNLKTLSPALIFSILSCSSRLDQANNRTLNLPASGKHVTPSSEASWGYSMLFVTLINLCSLTGALLLPCMKLARYKLLLMFMVALAVGTLAGSGLLFLIPEAFALVHSDDIGYIWKASTIMGGIYLFYITEKIMRMINTRRENTNSKKKRDELATLGAITTSFRRIPLDNSIPGKNFSNIPENIGGICSSHSHSSSYSICSQAQAADLSPIETKMVETASGDAPYMAASACEKHMTNGHRHHHRHHGGADIAPVAYMIIFGDALHNFIDGLSIGSAFTQSIMTGVGVSVAVMCEELPHELGDFAILLNSGMQFKKAIFYNFLSACTCYVGVVVGILLGENTHSHEWIFAVAGGMFLYISLVDMMPEMNTAAESPEGRQFGQVKTFLLQNVGLLTGYGIMLVMALYGGNIDFG
ncbi:unnamed protein product [Lymnaea stagnalis]|uniref:Zinc transporter ZIP14 n=1 Tax=Lymnaea stagnalis TaxID=6523 RepID=A0AAV2HSV6_LYMST